MSAIAGGVFMEMVSLSINSQGFAAECSWNKLKPSCGLKALPRFLFFPSQAPFSPAFLLFLEHSGARPHFRLISTKWSPHSNRHLISNVTSLERTLWQPWSLPFPCPPAPSFHWSSLVFFRAFASPQVSSHVPSQNVSSIKRGLCLYPRCLGQCPAY